MLTGGDGPGVGGDAVLPGAVAADGFDARIAALFAPLQNARGAVLAVSGGPDSMALMLLAAAWSRQRDGACALHVATVDHNLRPEAAAEAAFVGTVARSLGLPHRTLVWSHDKPRSRLQERARLARYALLCAHAQSLGADHLLTAHHADDQAETILFRLLRGSGPAGLAGMAASVMRHGITHGRPLLGLPKSALVAFCRARGQVFLEDPSNENTTFARGRLRRLAPILAENGLDRASLVRLGRRAARAEAALAASAASQAAALPVKRQPDLFQATAGDLAGLSEEILLRLLAAEITRLCDGAAPRLDRLERLTALVRGGIEAGRAVSTTLGGTFVQLKVDGTLSIRPAPPRR